jgi:hypothetical protein
MTNVEPTATPATVAAPPRTARSKKSAKPAKATPPRAGSKGANILALIRGGATLAAITKATGWQAHSVRGFLSVARSRHGLKIESARNKKGGRLHRATIESRRIQ